MKDPRQQIDRYLDPPAAAWVAEYFKLEGPFAADTFDTIGTNDPYRITTDDLLAVTFLDVAVSPPAARALLGPNAQHITDLLWAVPSEVDLWTASKEDLDRAERVWDFLDSLPGVGPVTAGKLLARKRPRLIPIVDSVVETLLEWPPDRYWMTLCEVLADQDVQAKVEALRPPGLDQRVSTLRLLDVALWMRGSGGRNAIAVRSGR